MTAPHIRPLLSRPNNLNIKLLLHKDGASSFNNNPGATNWTNDATNLLDSTTSHWPSSTAVQLPDVRLCRFHFYNTLESPFPGIEIGSGCPAFTDQEAVSGCSEATPESRNCGGRTLSYLLGGTRRYQSTYEAFLWSCFLQRRPYGLVQSSQKHLSSMQKGAFPTSNVPRQRCDCGKSTQGEDLSRGDKHPYHSFATDLWVYP